MNIIQLLKQTPLARYLTFPATPFHFVFSKVSQHYVDPLLISLNADGDNQCHQPGEAIG